jgi:hypothetical protein
MFFTPEVKYEHPDLGDANEVNDREAMEIATARWTGELLDRNYPGHPWHVVVRIDARGGVIQIQLGGVMPADRWYVCKMSDVISDVGGKRTVLRGAGEILERYGFRRGKFDACDWQAAMAKAPISGRGLLEPCR